jgi:hypothetical protein
MSRRAATPRSSKGSVMVKDLVHRWHILWLRPYPLLSSGDRVAATLLKKDALDDLMSWSRLSEQNPRVDKWSLCRV